ncbi:alpha/beta hydrolase [Marisediminicola senii]|uniref:alpha/beta hydrolase n=1 Tax=Marisediminicola senii TaxID=2711233 RepID=UPI0013EC1DAF|nr:alpha/beta hydrolase [Marisediminicola senii]
MNVTATTFLIASLGLGGLSGGFVAPWAPLAPSVTSVSISAPSSVSASSADMTVANTATPASAGTGDGSLRPVAGARSILDELSAIPAARLSSFVSDNAAAISTILANPPTARAVSNWWKLMPAASRDALLDSAPELVGNLDGVPSSLRDTANRVFLADTIADLDRQLDGLGRSERVEAEQRVHMLREIDEALDVAPGAAPRSLLSVDTEWPGRAAVAIGDLETADYVGYLIPGMFFTVDGQIVDWTVIAQDLHDEQEGWAERLGASDDTLADASIATVAWIGYQTPGIMDIISLDLATEGARHISGAVQGVQATRADDPHVTLLTHSYGSTATLMSLADGGLDVDSLVIIGSPGSAAQSVSDLGLGKDDVFVGEAAWDPVVHTAFFGSDPGADSFGASTMSVGGGTDPITGRELTAASGHLGYFDAGSEAMRNMALVALDRGDLVTSGESDRPTRLTAARE